jgi:hypothetical protein
VTGRKKNHTFQGRTMRALLYVAPFEKNPGERESEQSAGRDKERGRWEKGAEGRVTSQNRIFPIPFFPGESGEASTSRRLMPNGALRIVRQGKHC